MEIICPPKPKIITYGSSQKKCVLSGSQSYHPFLGLLQYTSLSESLVHSIVNLSASSAMMSALQGVGHLLVCGCPSVPGKGLAYSWHSINTYGMNITGECPGR